MNKIKHYFTFSLLIFVLCDFSKGQNLQIIHIDGVFDLDNDDLVEFLAFEETSETSEPLSRIAYYEIDDLGFPQLIWNVDSPQNINGEIVEVRLADLNGSGTYELLLAANVQVSENSDLTQGIIYVYNWEQESFSRSPIISSALTSPDSRQLINNIDIVDLNGDGKEEVAIALSGPESVITIVDIQENNGQEIFNEVLTFLLSDFSTSAGDIHVAGVDFGRDGLSDIIAFSPEKNVLRIQTFFNSNGILNIGPDQMQRIPGMSNILSRSINLTNLNNNEVDNILIPFQSGHVLSLSMNSLGINIEELGIDAGPLSDLKIADFNQDDINDLLLISGQQGVITVSYGAKEGEPPLNEYFSIGANEENDGPQIFSVVPEIVDDIYLGTVIAGGWTGQQSEIFYFEFGSLPEYPEEILVDTYIPQARIEETIEEMPIIPPAEGQPLPIGILPTYVLPVNQTFAYTIPEEDDREFFSFRWIEPPPRGMYFHYDTRSIEWVPDDLQLGAYQLSFLLKMKVGETVDILTTDEEGVVTYQVIPELATIESRFWIYVNDPPSIVSQPDQTEFVAGEPFIYQLDTKDKNEDAFIRYSLEKAPSGMEIDQSGLLNWKTDASHINIYEVRIVASDGFDRDVQNLQLYSRGQVVITSLPERTATINEEYRYNLNVHMPEEKQHELLYNLVYSPYGMMVDNTGLITWTPQSTQIDTQKFVVTANHGIAIDTQYVSIFVNHPPILSSVPDLMTNIALNDTFDFQLIIDDPNEFDIIRYEPISLPVGMRIDPSTGRILWVPNEANLDLSTAELEISDGHMSHIQSYDFFVNAPIEIISEPPTLGTVGEPYLYDIGIEDLNEGSLMSFSKITAINSIKDSRVYSIEIEDDVYRENIDRYIGEFNSKKSILIDFEKESDQNSQNLVARINLKRYVQNVFYEDDKLIVIINRVGGRTVKIKDVLWHFFQGNKGKPPKVLVNRVPFIRYSLLDFPDGMFIDEHSGTLSWTPNTNQYDTHTITYMVSDGYTRDEQSFELYINHPPTIISTAPKIARVDELYKYKVVVEDKNSDKDLSFELLRAPKGMQISRDGRITWNPTSSQINSRLFSVELSDGYTTDIQETRLFVNIAPNVLTQPKPVALTNFEYRYRMVVEDLNGDAVKLRPIKIPKYARFDPDTGMLRWKPRMAQRGINDIVLAAVDDRGATNSHEFQIHVFEDPSSQQFVSTSWPLLLAFVGTMFTAVAAIN
ncbi:MAG: hypothetical protein CMG75_02660 [Candidatus Marinimicrobia bacterium]|nr:hypothetical protein [Candidatus Neomarinimicrobiota bacterium]